MDVRYSVAVSALLVFLTAVAQADVENVTMTVDSQYLTYPPFAYANVVFNVTSGSPAPSGLNCTMDLRDGQGEREFELTLEQPYLLMFDDSGTYNITAIVTDLNSSKNLDVQVTVLDKLQGPLLIPEFSKAPFNLSMDVHFHLFSGPTGYLCNITWDFGNGYTVVRPRTGEGRNGSDVEKVVYATEGTYTLTVTAVTPAESVSVSRPIEIGEPLQETDFTIDVSPLSASLSDPVYVRVTFNPAVGSGPKKIPEDVYVFTDDGDPRGPRSSPTFFNTSKVPSVFLQRIDYNNEGQFQVTVIVLNNASWFQKAFEVKIFDNFLGPTVTKCFRPEVPRSLGCQNGLENGGNIFYAGTDITFEFHSINDATILFLEFYAVHTGGVTVEANVTTNPFVLNTLKLPGNWSVQVTAVNPLYQTTVNTNVRLVQKVVNFTLAHDRLQKEANVPKKFQISFDVQGLDTCLTIDFGDGTYRVYADDATHCTLTGPFSGLALSGALTGLAEVQHTFIEEDYYLVTAVAKSRYNQVTRHLHLDITSHNCMAPLVKIYNASHVFYEPHSYRRADIIKFRAIPRIECHPFDNNKTWEIHEIDPDWGNVTGSVALTDMKTDDAELRLERWALELGLYRVTFTITMTAYGGDFRFTGSDYSYFQVVRSELVGVMASGGVSQRPRSKIYPGSFPLYPLKGSYDADIVGGDPGVSGLSVNSWFCVFRTTPRDGLNPQVSDVAECPANVFTATTGPEGKIDVHSAALEIGKTYNFTAVLNKDTRYVAASLDVIAVGGKVQPLTIWCAAGTTCRQLQNEQVILKSARLGLRAGCGAPCALSQFSWNVSIHDYRWVSTGGWRPLLPEDMLIDGRTIGYETKAAELAIDPSLFDAFSSVQRFRVHVSTFDIAGIYRWAVTHFKLNSPPHGGTCTVQPDGMEATLEKLFRIRCQGWEDDTGIEAYQFYSYSDNDTVPVQITWVMTPQSHVDLNVTIGQGPKHLNYYTNVQVVVKDTMGAVTRQDIGAVRVTPRARSVTRDIIKQLPMDPKSALRRTSAEGDLISFTEFATIVGNIVNSDKEEDSAGSVVSSEEITTMSQETTTTAQETTESAYAIEEDRNNRAFLREKVFESITSLPLNDVMSMDQIMSTMSEFLKFVDEVTNQAQMTAVDTVLKMTEKLNDSESINSNERMKNLLYMISAKGSSLAAGGSSGFDGTLTMLDRAQADDRFQDYDPDVLARNDECLDYEKSYSFDDALDRQRRLTNCIITREKSTQLAEKGDEVMRRVFSSFQDNSILDESKQFDTLHQHTKLKLTGAKNIVSEPVTLDGSDVSAEFPGDLLDVFPDGSVGENDTVMIEITENVNIPLRYTTGGKNLADSTTFVTVDIQRNDTRQRLNVTGMAKPVKVNIPRNKQQPTVEYKRVEPFPNAWNTYIIHRTTIEKKGASLHVSLCLEMADVQLVVIMSLGGVVNHSLGICNASFLVPPQFSDPDQPECTGLMLDNEQVDDYLGPVTIGVRQLLPNETDLDVSDCTQLPDYWGNGTQDTQFTTNYTIKIFTSGCYFWSEEKKDWISDGLKVHPDTSDNMTVCEATHLTTFAGGMVVPPNTIDWDYVFSNFDFDRNPTLYGTEIVIFVAYILAVVWARRKDKKDLQKIGLAPLLDNYADDKYFYEIVVVTGMRRNAGTKSKVFFTLVGDREETDTREFSDDQRDIFQWGSVDGFLMSTTRSLGDLQWMRVWHDNSGQGEWGSWFLSHVTVRDVQTDKKWVFVANSWLAVEEGDGQISRVIPSGTNDQTADFSHTVSERCRRNLTDDHLWFSVVTRPPQSRFTRVQRVSCCLCLLLTSMLANAMFYRTDDDASETTSQTSVLRLGPFTLSPQQLFIGVVSNLIVFPVNLIIITLFRKARPRTKRPADVDKSASQADDNPEVVVSSPPKTTSLDANQPQRSISDGVREQSTPRAPPQLDNAKRGDKASSTDVGTTDPASAGAPPMLNEVNPSDITAAAGHEPQSTSGDPPPPAEGEKKKKKRKRGLPWWCRILAWILLVFTCLVCATFVTFYGIQFADSTCQKWISSMLISFFSSVLVTQPLKVFLLAIILSLIFKKADDDEDEERDDDDCKMGNDEVPLHATGTVDQGQTTTKEGEAKKKKRWVFASDGDYVGLEDDKTNGKGSKNNKPKQPGCTPLEGEALTAARARRLKELEMWRVVREIVIYVVFVTILLFVSYRDRLSNTFLYKDTMRRVFVANDVSNFEEVSNTKEYWEWARTGFLNGIRAGPYYNDLPPLMLRGYVNDKASKLLGYATMRQLRVKPRQCKVVKPMVGVVEECNTDYEYLNQEEGTFDLGWQPRTTTSTANDTAEWYRYTSSDELDSYPYWGELALYAGGGYVVRLEGSKSELLNLFTRLETEQWIDQYTRAVFIEFVIYNAQVNLFGIARILAEFQPNGGVVPSYRFEPANLLPYATSAYYAQLACEVLFCCFILFFALRLVIAMVKERLAFFSGFWNLVELGIVSMSVAAVVLFFYRLFETNQQMEKFHENNGVGFINFQYVGYWSEVFGYMLAWIVFLSVLKFLRLLRFNRRMSLLSSTLRACANGLLQLSLVFWIVFLAFAMLFFLTFMTIDDRYSSFIGSVVANILMIMGKFSVGTLMSAEPLLTQTYVFFYAVTLTFIILNMFVTVLNEGFGSVRADLTKQQNDYEIVDFMLSRLKGFFGVSNAQNLQNPEDDQEEAVEALTAVEKLPDRVDRLLSCLCRQFPEKSDALLQKLVATPSVSFHAAMKKVRALNRLNARRAAEAEAREKQKLSVIRLSSRKTKPAAPLAADKKEAPVPKPSAFGPTKKSNSRGGVTNRRGRGPVPRTNTSSTSGVAGRTKKEAAPHNTSVV